MNNKNEIPGWYDWDEWNQQTVARIARYCNDPDNCTYSDCPTAFCDKGKAVPVYVELGCFLGRSTVALAQHIQASGRGIQLNVVDTFALKAGDEPALLLALGAADPKLKPVKNQWKFRKVFERNLTAAGFAELPGAGHVLEKPSVAAAADFADGAVDVVFVDADHSYDAVVADIQAWWPKLKRGGVMAGHDIHTYDTVYRGVMSAVAALGLPVAAVNIIAAQNIWEIKKP